MFRIFSKKASAGRRATVEGQAILAKFDLSQKPYTNALLRTFLALQEEFEDQAERADFLKGEPREKLPSELDDLIVVAIMVLVPQMLRVALNSLDRGLDALPLPPGSAPPKDAPAFLAFALFLAFCFWVHARKEGFSIPLPDLSDPLARYVYPGWPSEHINQIRPLASELYDGVRSMRPETQEWLENTSMLATRYIEAQVNPAIQKVEIERLLGVMLRNLAGAIKYS